jgi:hypothetical protein
MSPLRNALATACISPLRTAKAAAGFSMLPTAKAYDSYVALFPNAANTRDDKPLRLTLCNAMTMKKMH